MTEVTDARFQRVEQEFRTLRAAYEAGQLSTEQLEQELQNRMLHVGGRYWMIGANSGKWYVYQDEQWIEAPPPTFRTVRVETAAPPPPSMPVSGTPPVPPPARPRTGPPVALRWLFGAAGGCFAPLLLLSGYGVLLIGTHRFAGLADVLAFSGAALAGIALPYALYRIPGWLCFAFAFAALLGTLAVARLPFLYVRLSWLRPEFLLRAMFLVVIGTFFGIVLRRLHD